MSSLLPVVHRFAAPSTLLALSLAVSGQGTGWQADLWSDPRGEFLSLAHASQVYALWGDRTIEAVGMPRLDTPLTVGRRGYHVRRGGHNLTPYDWDRFADFADVQWPR